MNELDHIVILAASMIAQGRPYYNEANVGTLVKQSRMIRNAILTALSDPPPLPEKAQVQPNLLKETDKTVTAATARI
ncbi:MAG TPA: hypothetical protein VJQ59_16940 [Candidatus Sulfotelmatobacter sp.]|nr:hypothetical protein [Candidatus Sulfotelmatobacter sp.]